MAVKVITFDEAMNDLYTEMANSWSKEEIVNYARNLTNRIREDEQTELKYLAKKYNYRLIPIKPYEKLLPCKCGRKQIGTWSCYDGPKHYIKRKCDKCGLEAIGKNEDEAKHNWNLMIKGESND